MAWLAFEEGKKNEALEMMRTAAGSESSTFKHPVTPGEVLPARELLADMLLVMGRPAAALAEYEASLQRSPNRFNSLYGVGRAAELADNRAKAASYYRKLIRVTADVAADRARLQHARAFSGS
jgi:tetratricopeptide (TPR) repeat protein